MLTPEIIQAFNNVKPIGLPTSTSDWKILFDYYNSKNNPVSMNCLPCFAKVYSFVKKEITLESVKS